MAHIKYDIKSNSDFYKKFNKVTNDNSITIKLENCNVKLNRIDFDFGKLCNVLNIDSKLRYKIIFSKCTFKKIFFIKENYNIYISFIDCCSNNLNILNSHFNGFQVKNLHSNITNFHNDINLKNSKITLISLNNKYKNLSNISISEVETNKLVIENFYANKASIDLTSIENLYIYSLTTNKLFIKSSLLSDNYILIQDASKINYFSLEECNLKNTIIKQLNLSKFDSKQNQMDGLKLINFNVDKKFDNLNNPILFLILTLLCYFTSINLLILFSIYFLTIYFSKHYYIYDEKLNYAEKANLYREYKNIFMTEGRLYWYHEMLYSEQLSLLKDKNIYKNIFNLKYYNYYINGFGRRWRRVLFLITLILFYLLLNVEKTTNYILTKNEIPEYIKTLYSSTNFYDNLYLNSIYILSKIDILKIQSGKWFQESNVISFFNMSFTGFLITFLIGAFILAFKRRLDR